MADDMQPERGRLFDAAFLARLEQLHVMAKRLRGGDSAGRRRSRRVGDGLEFADHRAYAPGDDVRFIDWPYYARMERLFRRLFHEHSEAPLAILLDVSASMGADVPARGRLGKFDYARRVAAALVYVAVASLERVTLAPFAGGPAEPLTVGRNIRQMPRVLAFLSALTPGGPTQLLAATQRLVGRYDQPMTVLLVSDLLDCEDDLSSALAALAQARCDVTVLQVQSPTDASPEIRGAAALVGTEADRQMNVEITDDLIAAYRQQWLQFVDDCQRACAARGAIYVGAPTDVPVEKLVLEGLRRAGVLVG